MAEENGDVSGVATLTKKDFTSDQEPRWCPGCGDYAILAAVQGFMPELGIEPHNTVFISGIGCSGRFTYYMDTYGFHGIHGRAPAIATGVATANPDLHVWVVTGDGEALSIGGNDPVHARRRNVHRKILMLHNQIRLVDGEPIVFDEGTRCVRVGENGRLEIAAVAGSDPSSIITHDIHGRPSLAFALAHLSHGPTEPTCIGVFHEEDRSTYGE